MTFHCGDRKLQLRASGRARLHVSGELFETGWSLIGLGSRRCYLAPHAPTSASSQWSANLPEHLVGQTPSTESAEAGREQFAVVALEVDALDLLVVYRKGHRRARFRLRAGQLSESTWLHP